MNQTQAREIGRQYGLTLKDIEWRINQLYAFGQNVSPNEVIAAMGGKVEPAQNLPEMAHA